MFFIDWIWKSGFSLTNIIISILAGVGAGILLARLYKRKIQKIGIIILAILLFLSPMIGVSTYLIRINDLIVHCNITLFMAILSFGLIKLLKPEAIPS